MADTGEESTPMHAQAILEAMDGIALLLDQNLTITMLGQRNWNDFWRKNGGVIAQGTVVGQDITRSFTTGEVRDTYRHLFHSVMDGKRSLITIDYRCDSATIRRSMRLTVTHVPGSDAQGNLLLYQSTTLSQEQRPAIPLFEAAAEGMHKVGQVKLCSICARVQWPAEGDKPASEWMEPTEYYRRGGEDVTVLTHGFCQPCYLKIVAEDT